MLIGLEAVCVTGRKPSEQAFGDTRLGQADPVDHFGYRVGVSKAIELGCDNQTWFRKHKTKHIIVIERYFALSSIEEAKAWLQRVQFPESPVAAGRPGIAGISQGSPATETGYTCDAIIERTGIHRSQRTA